MDITNISLFFRNASLVIYCYLKKGPQDLVARNNKHVPSLCFRGLESQVGLSWGPLAQVSAEVAAEVLDGAAGQLADDCSHILRLLYQFQCVSVFLGFPV